MKHDTKHGMAAGLWVIALLVAGSSIAFAGPPPYVWGYGFGSTGDDDGLNVAVDASGNVYMAGNFQGTVNFGGGNLTSAGGPDVFIAKYDAFGAHQWSKRFGGTLYDYQSGLAVDASGNVYAIGYFQGTANFGGSNLTSAGAADIYVAKYNSSGVHQWSQRFGDASDQFGYRIAVDTADNVAVTGVFTGTVDFGGGGLTAFWDVFLAKYDINGVHQWSQRFGGTGDDRGTGVAMDASGNVYLTGRFQNTANFGGGDLVSAGVDDVVLAKYNSAGVHQWSERFGGSGYDDSNSLAVDAAGNVLITGSFGGVANFGGGDLGSSGNTDIFVAKYNTGGAHQWSRAFGNTGWNDSRSIAVDGSGNALVTGWFEGTINAGGANLVSAGSRDIVLAMYDANGVHQWSERFGGTGDDRAYSVAADQSGNVTTTGDFQATVDFGGGSLVSAGGRDLYLAKFGHNPYEPGITSISDIGNDQGKKVKIRFNRSSLDDTSSSTPVLRYVAFRRDSPAPPESSLRGPSDQRARLDVGWTEVGSVHAFGTNSYGIDVPTLGDSTLAHGQYYSVFFVRAATAIPSLFFDSLPDSGYSLDNLAPGVPQNLAYAAGVLSWKESTAKDFNYFSVYGSDADSFGAATLIDYCVAPSMNVMASQYTYYFVTATDFSGNEGKPATLNIRTGVGGTPSQYVLSISAFPNPFNPATTIRYTVPSNGRVEVSVYDTRGAHIATLVNDEKAAGAYTQPWNGRDDAGQAVSSGVYFARVTHPQGTRSYKMVLLK